MKKSPVYPNYGASDYGGHEFDPLVDFLQFLEEAKQHAREVNIQASSQHSANHSPAKEKKNKKSWKSCLFSWWKAEKKSKPSMEVAKTSNISKPRRGHVSGPIYESVKEESMRLRHQRQTSGPIINLFNSKRRAENEIPYLSLDQLGDHDSTDDDHANAYGPVYLVS